MLQELDTIEKRVKNLQLSEVVADDANMVLQEVEITEPSTETIKELRPKRLIDTIHRDAQKQQNRFSLFERHKTERAAAKKTRRSFFSYKKQPSNLKPPVDPEVHRHMRGRRETVKPVQSTFKLYISEEGALAGLDIKRPQPPKTRNGLFGRRHKTDTSDQPQETQEPGFKGKMKRLASKILPRASRKGETSTGLGSKIKGIVKRRPREQK